MKKLYTLALAMAAVLTANAQLYVVGGFDGEDHWTPETPVEAQLNADGNYEITLHDCGGFKVSTAFGDWATLEGAAFSINGGNITKEFMNDFFAVEPWGGNTTLPWTGDWTVEVTPDYSKMKLTTTTPEVTTPVSAWVVGGFNGWGDGFVEGSQWQMTAVEMFHYTFKFTGETILPAGEEFKFAGASWSMINYTVGGEVLVDGMPEEEVPYDQGANMYFSEENVECVCDLVMPLGYNQPATITFTKLGAGVEGVTVENNAKAVYYNLQGVEVANPEAGLYIVRRGDKVSKVLVK